jgi:signal transduction histidine kinase/ActR/RegA family two-component response regulator
MNYSLKELLDIPKLQQLLDSLYEIHSMPSAIIDMEGNILIATAWQDICTKFHRQNPDTKKMCIESDGHIQARLEEKPPHVVFRCPLGLVDSSTPIIIEGKHLGNVFAGQCFIEPSDEAYFVEQARKYGFCENDYIEALRKVPFSTMDTLHKNLTFLENLVHMLVDNGLQLKRHAEAEEAQKEEQDKLSLEQQSQQSQKMESLGVFVDGIAHDFNNILAIIIGYCSLAEMGYEASENHIPGIEIAAERAAELCRQIAEKTKLAQSQVNMGTLVNEMVKMLKSTINLNAVIKLDLPPELPLIKGDASQLRQIVMNLIINASEAIGEEQGEIYVSLEKTQVIEGQSEKDHLGQDIPPGWYVCMEISDNGCGMDDDTKQRIFEPFYTTKFTGRGLGLSAVLGIITAHDGVLQLISQPGQGTTFKVYLPTQTGNFVRDESHPEVSSSEPWQGSGTILLVEDEAQIILIANNMLTMLGFTVIEASNGKEALELYQKNAADISLVVTDMGMPVMDGFELFHELKKLNPELPIIISSGFVNTVVTSRIAREDIAGLVSKPYSFAQLREVLKSVVENNRGVLTAST